MKTTEKIALCIVMAYGVFHLLILLQILPFNMVWGGRIESTNAIYALESIALVVMSFLGVVILMKNRIIKPIFTKNVVKRILLVFAIYFTINTIGNLLAKTLIEKTQAIITLLLAIILFKSSKEIETL